MSLTSHLSMLYFHRRVIGNAAGSAVLIRRSLLLRGTMCQDNTWIGY